MPETPKKFYLTTPIYYVNARPHIGHAYSTIAADVIARRHRLLGDDTFFLTGTDEHGQKVQRSAEAAGIPPQQFADEVSATFRNLWKRMGITNDDYIRTTDERHKRGVQKLWRDLEARGAIYLSTYTGQYSVGEEMFVEGPPGTIGPDGKPTETVTEENYFFDLKRYQKDLIDLIESDDPNAPLRIQPEAVRNEVLSFVRGGQAKIVDGKLKILDANLWEFTKDGNPYVPGALKDLSISRTTFDWGIPVPTNPKHVVYVWLDALVNYITAIGYGSDDPADIAKFERYWPADVHLVGKEITRFHCVYWPAFLMAAEIPLPKSVVANGWLLFEESKMSKSRGNVVRTETILDAFGDEVYGKQFSGSTKNERDLFAADVLRYFLLREIPFGQDGSFSFDALITRYNADLANGYGNLVSRTLTMIHKYFAGVVPLPQAVRPLDKTIMPEWWVSDPLTTQANFYEESKPDPFLQYRYISIRDAHKQVGLSLDTELVVHGGKYFYPANEGLNTWEFFQVAIDPLLRLANESSWTKNLTRVIEFIAEQIKLVDEFLSLSKPWKLTDEDPRRAYILGVAVEYVRLLTAVLYPVIPYATASVWRQLGLGSIEEAARKGELKNLQWGGLKPGTKLGPLAPIFPRADKGLAQIMTDMESPAPTLQTPESVKSVVDTVPASIPEKSVQSVSSVLSISPAETTEATPPISIDDFAKIDLRVAQIVVAERIPKADKLLRLEVDLGTERRQILSGIAEFYTPEELIGKRIAIIANLAPRKMRGLESHGMLLPASGEDHSSKPILATFSDEIALGSKIR
ncbi:MAG TPA: methionine--tRNA ligase subunit beta [Acidobacteriaceae bacterium]